TAYAGGGSLLRFFAIFYTATSLATFLVQTTATRRVLEKLGVARTVLSLPAVLAAGGAVALIAPGLAVVASARGAETMVRGSLFRSAYELLYVPVAPEEKRTAKALIDVGGERLGDLAGAGLITLVVLVLPAASHTALLGGAIALAARARDGARARRQPGSRDARRAVADSERPHAVGPPRGGRSRVPGAAGTGLAAGRAAGRG
ncbi:MAG TPA: Npt1/Npt2 family nucleotide transporter, partial [Kofleriaceae bacterium]